MNKLTKSTIGTLIAGSMIALVAALTPMAPVTYAAENCGNNATNRGIEGGLDCADTGTPDQLFGTNSIFTTIINTLLFVIGAISVVMLIIGGIRYTVSSGDSGAITGAKNTILYAIVGLIIAFLAYAIVNWVLVAINPGA